MAFFSFLFFPLYAASANLTLYCLPIVSDSAYSTLVSAFSAFKKESGKSLAPYLFYITTA